MSNNGPVEVLVRIRKFKPKEIILEEVNILGLELIDEQWKKKVLEVNSEANVEAKIESLVDEILSRNTNSKELFVEVEASIPGLTIRKGEGDYTGRIVVLSPKPARLFRVGILIGEPSKVDGKIELQKEKTSTMQVVVSEESSIDENSKQAGETSSTGNNTRKFSSEEVIDLNKLSWHSIANDIYIYEGFIITKKPWKAIVFVTDAGTRILLPGDFEAKKLDVGIEPEKQKQKKKKKRRKKTKKTKKKRKRRKKKG